MPLVAGRELSRDDAGIVTVEVADALDDHRLRQRCRIAHREAVVLIPGHGERGAGPQADWPADAGQPPAAAALLQRRLEGSPDLCGALFLVVENEPDPLSGVHVHTAAGHRAGRPVEVRLP